MSQACAGSYCCVASVQGFWLVKSGRWHGCQVTISSQILPMLAALNRGDWQVASSRMNPPTSSRWNFDLSDAIPLMRGGPGHLLKKSAENLRPRPWRRLAKLPGPTPPAGDPALLASEVAALPGDVLLAALGDLEVSLAGADAIPNALNEIGRLRELFCFHPSFLPNLGPSLELGRSFVTPAYQRTPYSLFLLWKGIGEISSQAAGLEQDAMGLPVLLRRYVALNATLLKFNVNRQFSDSFDGLVVVDLRAADPRMMTRYMGAEGWHEFCQMHPAPWRKPKGNPA